MGAERKKKVSFAPRHYGLMLSDFSKHRIKFKSFDRWGENVNKSSALRENRDKNKTLMKVSISWNLRGTFVN